MSTACIDTSGDRSDLLPLARAAALDTSGDRSDWLPLTRAAALAGVTPYTIKTAVIGGRIRARVIPGFPTKYSKSDTLRFVESCA